MNATDQAPKNRPSQREKTCVILLAALMALLIGWGLFEFSLFQFAYVLAVLCLGVTAVILIAAWRKGFRWFLTRGAVRFYVWFVLGLISVVALFYNFERWRGHRAWAVAQKEAAARGHSLELSSIIPPEIPDEQNFARAPGVLQVLRFGTNSQLVNRTDSLFFHGDEQEWPDASWTAGTFTDLIEWQGFLARQLGTNSVQASGGPAETVLALLARYEQALAPLCVATSRPYARYPVDYAQGWMGLSKMYPLLTDLRFAAHLLSLRASALLAANQPEAALQDVLVALHLAGTLEQPFASAHYYKMLMFMDALQPAWEGLSQHAWNEAQIRRLEEKLRPWDFWNDAKTVVYGETILMIEMATQLEAYLQGGSSRFREELARQKGADAFMVWLFKTFYPTGWLAQDKALIYRFYAERFANASPETYRHPSQGEWRRRLMSIADPLMLTFAFPRLVELSSNLEWSLFLECAQAQALAACELERQRSAGAEWPPSSWEAAVAAGLKTVPQDPMAGPDKPMVYKPTKDGFLIYSIGLNRVDDGGKPFPVDHRFYPRFDQGDWVWVSKGNR